LSSFQAHSQTIMASAFCWCTSSILSESLSLCKSRNCFSLLPLQKIHWHGHILGSISAPELHHVRILSISDSVRLFPVFLFLIRTPMFLFSWVHNLPFLPSPTRHCLSN
jgi:hypothetical protein